MENYDSLEFIGDYETDPETYDEHYSILAQICALDQYNKPYDELSEDELDELRLDQVIRVKVIDCESLLFQGLREWFGGHNNVVKGVRSGIYESNRIYFGTGIGYDTTSDLLACDCDGTAYDEFVNFCNEDYEAMKKGGYAYLQSKGKEFCAHDRLKTLCSECC